MTRLLAAGRGVVECLGLPGAGKSHLVRGMVAQAVRAGVDLTWLDGGMGPEVPRARRLARKAAVVSREVALRPVSSLEQVRTIARSQQQRRLDVPKLTVQSLVAQRLLWRAHRQAALTILDEGHLQAVWSTLVRSSTAVDPHVAERLSSARATRPDLVVLVLCSPGRAAVRLGERTSRHSRFQSAGAPSMLERELARGEELLAALTGAWVDAAGSDALFVVDGSSTSATAALAGVLERMR